MNIEWVNVADTAVKIGLGGVVSGVFTYMGLRYSHKSQQSKYLFEHKIKLVEQITADIDEYFNALINMVSIVDGIAMTRQIKKLEDSPLHDNEMEAIRSRDSILVSSRAKRTYAIAKLRLLKATNVVQKLNECSLLENKLREKIIFNKEMYKLDEIQSFRKQVGIVTSEVHSALSDFYDSLLK